jgi:hypothetical protein
VNSLRCCVGCHGDFFSDELDAFGACEDCAPAAREYEQAGVEFYSDDEDEEA